MVNLRIKFRNHDWCKPSFFCMYSWQSMGIERQLGRIIPVCTSMECSKEHQWMGRGSYCPVIPLGPRWRRKECDEQNFFKRALSGILFLTCLGSRTRRTHIISRVCVEHFHFFRIQYCSSEFSGRSSCPPESYHVHPYYVNNECRVKYELLKITVWDLEQ
jgi:hypothetical protein